MAKLGQGAIVVEAVVREPPVTHAHCNEGGKYGSDVDEHIKYLEPGVAVGGVASRRTSALQELASYP